MNINTGEQQQQKTIRNVIIQMEESIIRKYANVLTM